MLALGGPHCGEDDAFSGIMKANVGVPKCLVLQSIKEPCYLAFGAQDGEILECLRRAGFGGPAWKILPRHPSSAYAGITDTSITIGVSPTSSLAGEIASTSEFVFDMIDNVAAAPCLIE